MSLSNFFFKDGETHLKFELHPLGEGDDLTEESAKAAQIAEKPLPMISDDSPTRAFLNGENCLNGVSLTAFCTKTCEPTV